MNIGMYSSCIYIHMGADLGMSLVLSSTQVANYLSDGMGKFLFIYCQKEEKRILIHKTYQEIGDNDRLYLHSPLHPSMEHVFSHCTVAATISAFV